MAMSFYWAEGHHAKPKTDPATHSHAVGYILCKALVSFPPKLYSYKGKKKKNCENFACKNRSRCAIPKSVSLQTITCEVIY